MSSGGRNDGTWTIKSVFKQGKGLLTGAAIGALVVAGGLIYGIPYGWQHRDTILGLVAKAEVTKAEAKEVAKPAPDRFPKPFYITIYNGKKLNESDEDHGLQVFEVNLKGFNTFEGHLVDMKSHNRAVVTGHWRAHALVLEYASESEERPGYGSFVLRADISAFADQSASLEGVALTHDCQCKGKAYPVGPMTQVTAVLTPTQNVPQEIAAKYLYAREPVKIDAGYFPPQAPADSVAPKQNAAR